MSGFTNKLQKDIEEKYRTQLICMLYDLAEKNLGGEEVTLNVSVGSITIKLNK